MSESIFDEYREHNREYRFKSRSQPKKEQRFKGLSNRLKKIKVSSKGYTNKPSSHAKSSIGSVLRKL